MLRYFYGASSYIGSGQSGALNYVSSLKYHKTWLLEVSDHVHCSAGRFSQALCQGVAEDRVFSWTRSLSMGCWETFERSVRSNIQP